MCTKHVVIFREQKYFNIISVSEVSHLALYENYFYNTEKRKVIQLIFDLNIISLSLVSHIRVCKCLRQPDTKLCNFLFLELKIAHCCLSFVVGATWDI